MQLENGKFYKDGHGVRVEIIGQKGHLFFGYGEDQPKASIYNQDGQLNVFCCLTCNLIEEWPEPSMVIERWLKVKQCGATMMYDHDIGDQDCLHIKIDLSKPKGQRIWEVLDSEQ